jgi:imidazoleglycerol-phosphate dehydratase/histidinol-phosphatase
MPRTSRFVRKTAETEIMVEINLDGNGKSWINTGIGFFDHMLEQIARHGNIDIMIQAKGDLKVDEHHTIEDVGIALGEAFLKALGGKKGIERYSFALPMDDCLAQVAIDLGGRPWLVWDVELKREKIGEMPSEMFFHFFKSFSDNARCNLNISARGENEHHKAECVFKAFAKVLRSAVKQTDDYKLPSTKGIL